MKKCLQFSLFWVALFLTFRVSAQERAVTGKVAAADDNSPLVGVAVSLKGTTRGTTTDASGQYRLAVPGNSTLVFSYVGFTRQEVAVGNRTTVDVALQSDAANLSEIVVTGYGQQIKRDLTGNLVQLDSKQLTNTPTPSVENALQGQAAGVQVTQGNGKLGQGISVRVRGASSISASNQPLYVVDGIPINTQDLSSNSAPTNPVADINAQDIESISILKDASAAAIYGSRAANGVVLITTKRGKAGRTNVNVGFQYGFSKPTRLRKYMNAKEWTDYFTTAAKNSSAIDGGDPFYTDFLASRITRYSAGTAAGTVDTDWQKEAFQSAPLTQTDLNINGGSDRTKFYVSGQYLNQKGILIKNALERLSARVNLDHQANNWLRLGINMSLARTLQTRVSNDNAFSTPMQIVALSPITPKIDPRSGLTSGTPPGASSNYPIYYNPLLNAEYSDYKTLVFRNISSVYGQVDIKPWLNFRSELGVDILTQNEDGYYGVETARNSQATNGLGVSTYAQIMNYNTNNYFSLARTFNNVHELTATLGMSYQESRSDFNSVEGQQFPSNSYRKIASAADITAGSSSRTVFSFLSYFARANYKYANKYLLSLSARMDGSSRFGKNSKYGFFPAASVGWVLSEEAFLRDNDVVSFLKLRGSYGLTGNSEIGNFPALGLYSTAGYAGVAGQGPAQLGNPGLKWETTAQADIGVDFGFFNNRINGEIDYYNKQTRDLLLNVNVPGTTGFTTQTQNVGKLENKGFEVVINSSNLTGAFRWNTSLNFSTNRNKITDIQGQIITGGFDEVNRAVEGQPLGSFFMLEYAGVDPKNGDALFYKNATEGDRSTTNDPNQAQRVVVGSPLPKWFGGITNTVGYKGFELSVLVNTQQGNKVYLAGGKFEMASGDFLDNHLASELDYWTPQNTTASTPQPRLLYANGTAVSSRYLSDASYVRLRNVTLSYNFPKPFLGKLGMNSLRVFAIGQNLLTFTNYKGWDPEVSTDALRGAVSAGNDFYSAPQARTITVGLNIGL